MCVCVCVCVCVSVCLSVCVCVSVYVCACQFVCAWMHWDILTDLKSQKVSEMSDSVTVASASGVVHVESSEQTKCAPRAVTGADRLSDESESSESWPCTIWFGKQQCHKRFHTRAETVAVLHFRLLDERFPFS